MQLEDKPKKICVLNNVSTRIMGDNDNLSGSKCEASDTEKGSMLLSHSEQETAELSGNDSQESGNLSQGKALGFVDHYLSLNNINIFEEDRPRKSSRLKSPPTLCAKGPQTLARRATFGTAFGSSPTFEWDDDHVDKGEERVLEKKDTNGSFDVPKLRSVTKHHCHQIFLGERLCTDFSNSKVQNNEVVDEVDQVPEMIFVKELDGQLNDKTSGQLIGAGSLGRDVPDAFDIGFDTQVAAEAMEALFYALPSNSITDHAHQDPTDMTGNSSVGTGTHSNSVFAARKLKQTIGTSKRLNGQISRSSQRNSRNKKELDPELLKAKDKTRKMRQKSVTETDSNSVCHSSFYSTEQGKEDKDLERNNIKEVSKIFISSTKGQRNSHGEVPLQRKCRNLSSIAHRTRHSSKRHPLEETEDQRNTSGKRMGNIVELGVLKKTKKYENADMFQSLTVRERHSNNHLHSSEETGNLEANQQQQKALDAAPVSCRLKLEGWSFPKGKRKHRKVRSLLKGVSTFREPVLIKGGIGNDYSVGSTKNSQENSGSSCISVYVRRKSRLPVHAHQFQSSVILNHEESSLQKSDEHSFTDVMNEEMTSSDQGKVEASRLCGSVDDVDPTLHAKGANKNSEKLPKGSVCHNGSENHHQFCYKGRARFPLMKELLSLGIPESHFNTESKHLRRRRDLTSVCVLFSQNMDDHIIKKQKKILERLGSSIASSCSNATHFIADRFVRTRNMLEAIALGKPVVTHLWVDICGQASLFVDEKHYILRDAKKEKEIGFSMPVSLANARQHPLLKGRRIFMTPNIKPGKELIVNLAKAVHGKICSEAEDRSLEAIMENEVIPDDLLILSCEEDYALCRPFLEKGVAIYSSELLFNGIITQKLELERHQLFKSHSKIKS